MSDFAKDTNVPTNDYISRQAAINVADSADYTGLSVEDVKKVTDEVVKALKMLPSVDAEPVVRCKDCKYFDLNHFENARGIPLIVAHEICNRWGNGCKTDTNGFCFMGERRSE